MDLIQRTKTFAMTDSDCERMGTNTSTVAFRIQALWNTTQKKNMTFSSARTERSKGPVIKVCKTLTWRTGPVWGRVALFGEPRTFLSEVLP